MPSGSSNLYTERDLIGYKENKYMPTPCIILRKCKVCGEVLEEFHPDYNAARTQNLRQAEHECDKVWHDAPNGTVIGKADVIGFVINIEINQA